MEHNRKIMTMINDLHFLEIEFSIPYFIEIYFHKSYLWRLPSKNFTAFYSYYDFNG